MTIKRLTIALTQKQYHGLQLLSREEDWVGWRTLSLSTGVLLRLRYHGYVEDRWTADGYRYRITDAGRKRLEL